MNSIRPKRSRIPPHEKFIRRDLNRIYPQKLNYLNAVADFIGCVLSAKNSGFEDFIIDLSEETPDDKAFYPNIIVPITAFMNNLVESEGVTFSLENDEKNMSHTNLLNPANGSQINSYPNILNRVWRFSSEEEITALVDGYMDAIYKEDEFASKDILVWLEWCLNEVMDNVTVHSNASSGFVMGQVHSSSKTIAFCIADAGRGVYRSFRDSSILWPKDERDAIEMALREGVTRDPAVGQGNGLWGLHEVSVKTNGRLRLGSGGSMLKVNEDALFMVYPYLNNQKGGTVVDFTFDYSKPVDLRDVLGGHQPESMKVYSSTDEASGAIKYKLADQKSGFGTRRSGLKIKNEISNYLLENAIVEVDFSDINIVSSSFADECIGKLYVEIGPVSFQEKIRLINMNPTISAIVNKAILQRVAQAMSGKGSSES